MPKKVVVTVDENSLTRTDYINFQGSDCLAAGQRFHQLLAQLGVQVEQTNMIPKPELQEVLHQQQELAPQHQQHQAGKEE